MTIKISKEAQAKKVMKSNKKYQHEMLFLKQRLIKKHRRAREARPFRPAWTESRESSTKNANKEGALVHKEPLLQDCKASLRRTKPHLPLKSHSNWNPPSAIRSKHQRALKIFSNSSRLLHLPLQRSPTHRRPNGRSWLKRSSECSRGRSRIWTRSSSCSRSCLGRTRGSSGRT